MRLELLRPDDWHLHLRDGDGMRSVLADTARVFARAIVMPNLKPPVTTVAAAAAYRERILAARPRGSTFEPLMTLYLTDRTSPDEIRLAKQSGFVHGVKYYPAGATTNAENGVTAWQSARPALEAMAEFDVPLLVHGEVTAPTVDVFDRELVFLTEILEPLRRTIPGLCVVLEHVTTAEAVDYVLAGGPRIAATITPQHLLWNRNELFRGGIRPHAYCLPVLKRERHREALVRAATGDNPQFFLGSDSAPHARHTKETTCGCAGVYSAPCALELYAEAFEAVGALDRLEAFASRRGATFYRLPLNTERITLETGEWRVPDCVPFGEATLVPMRAGEVLNWRVV